MGLTLLPEGAVLLSRGPRPLASSAPQDEEEMKKEGKDVCKLSFQKDSGKEYCDIYISFIWRWLQSSLGITAFILSSYVPS